MLAVATPPKSEEGTLRNSAAPITADADRLVLLPNATWAQYKQMQKIVETNGCGNVSLFQGWLEIMTVSKRHEELKSRLRILLESYCVHLDIEYFPLGEATIETKRARSGGQPDESYCFHEKKTYPDLVIEIALASGGIDKLKFYQQHEIAEAWVWENEALSVYMLGSSGYVLSEKKPMLSRIESRFFDRMCCHRKHARSKKDVYGQFADMMRQTILLVNLVGISWLLSLGSIAAAEETAGPKHPIEAAMDAAMEEDGSTAGMMKAIAAAQQAWDDLLNRHYTKLRALLGENDSEKMKTAQRAWIVFRDSELEALKMIYGKMEGTMYRPMHAYAAMDLVKSRALALGRRVEMLEQR